MRIQPHRTSSSVTWEPVHVFVDGVEDAPWDYLSTVQIRSGVSVGESFLAETGLESLRDIVGLMIVDCPSTGWRKLTRCRVTEETAALVMDIGPGVVARTLVISHAIALASPTEGQGGTAMHVGDRLNEAERFQYDLEGVGERFPIEAVDFGPLGLPPRALWDLQFDPEGWDDIYAAVVRLRVNTKHPMCDALLSSDHDDHRLVITVLRREIITQLLQHMSKFEDDLDGRDFEADSVASVIGAMCETYLKMPLATTLVHIRADPAAVGLRLQNTTDFLRRQAP